MARGHLTFKQSDLTRAIKAALKAGVIVERAWIDVDGKIMLGFTKPVEIEPPREQQEIIL
jgi:hypothetical protein